MAFEKGMPKPPGSGIKKGQKQKPRVEKETVRQMLDNLGINPIHQLLKYTGEKSRLPEKDKARIWIELCSYCYTKPRIDMNVEMENINQPQTDLILSEVGTKIIESLNKWNSEK